MRGRIAADMDYVALIPAAILFLSAGCQDSRVTNLEQRVNQLENKIRQQETDHAKNADEEAARKLKLEACVFRANAEFEASLDSNGTKARNGSYNVPVPVAAEMQRQKQGKIEECRLLYSK